MKTHTLLVLAILTATPAFGYTELSFEDCVREASENNPSLKASKSVLRSSSYDITLAYSKFYPQLSTQFSYNYSNSTTAGTPSGGVVNPSISANYNLFSGNKDISLVKQAKANEEAANADLALVKSQVSFELKTAFANLLRAQELLKVNESIKAQRETNYKFVSLLFDSGLEDKGSVLFAKANLDLANASIEDALENTRAASVQLSKVLGQPPNAELRVRGTIPALNMPSDIDFEKLAIDTPGYKKAQAQYNAAIQNKNVVRSEYFPTLDLSANVSETSTSQTHNLSFLAGLRINYSLFSGRSTVTGIRKAQQAITTAEFNKRSTQLQDATSISDAYFALQEALRRRETNKSFLDALAVRSKIATERYNTGLLNFQNWDQIESSFIQRKQAVVADEPNVAIAQAALERAMGIGVIE